MTTPRDERLARAVELRENGQLEEARQRLLELRAEFPDDAQAAVQTAWVHDSLQIPRCGPGPRHMPRWLG